MAKKYDPDRLIAEMVGQNGIGKYVGAPSWRKSIDRNQEVRQFIALDNAYRARLREFVAVAKKTERERGAKAQFEFGGQRYQAGAAIRDAAGILNRADARFGRGNFRQQNRLARRLFPELVERINSEGITELFELGHDEISVLRSLLARTIDAMESTDPRRAPLVKLYAIVLQADKVTQADNASMEKVFDALEAAAAEGYSVKGDIRRDVDITKGVRGSIALAYELKKINQLKGKVAAIVGQISKQVIEGNIDNITNDVFKKVNVLDITGSPTLEEELAQQYFDLIDPNRKQKGSKSRRKAEKKSKGVGLKTKKPKRTSVGKIPRNIQKGVSSSPLQFIGLINQQLPQTVMGNMGPPALENRTGRFAGSVKVVDVQTTAQGFPSFGYTYQKTPYQTFEPGFRQGDTDRDPRKLIDRSIRDIAVQFALGRFYTRRV